jgi:8-oxo-dGTP diphosphatase
MQTNELTLDGLPDLPQMDTLKRVAARLWNETAVVALWLGGSVARGKADAHSDIDLRVAVRPEALARWQEPDLAALSALIGETVVGMHTLRWEGTVLHQFLLAEGVIWDLLIQSAEREPPQDFTLVLGCRDNEFGQRLASACLPLMEEAAPADPDAIREAITNFWIGSHKHIRMLSRGLDLLILHGLSIEQSVLMRLWYVEATGKDQITQRPTIHTLTPMMRAITEAFGPHSLETLGLTRTNRAEIMRAIDANRNEVAAIGRRLALRLGFEYPDTLEQTVRHAWAQYQTESAAPEFGLRLAGQTYVPRPGSYALLFNEQGQIAVMETPNGGFLPGGGAEAGETPEEALRREVREECGFEIGNISPLGEAVQYVYTPGNEAGIRKDCTFFEAQVSAADGMATEWGHVLLWRTPAEAERSLAHESQTWAVCKSRRES